MYNKSNRYPGIRPYNTDERQLFFGRQKDVDNFLRLLNLEQVTILYGKSGYGKSSLLKAGLFPKLNEIKRYKWWEIRLGAYSKDKMSPVEIISDVILSNPLNHQSVFFEKLTGREHIWSSLKVNQNRDSKRFILFFDQFEEIFTYPPEQILQFKQQLSQALYNAIPEDLALSFESTLGYLNEEQDQLFYTPFELKVVFAIRSDRMSLLNDLKDYLPNLLQHAYELRALDVAGAQAAIVQPALLQQNNRFTSPSFQYSSDAVAAIVSSLIEPDGNIETSNLQIVCRHIEDKIVIPTNNTRSFKDSILITKEELGDIKSIFKGFYENSIRTFTEPERAVARRIMEELLVSHDGIRLPFAEQALLSEPGVSKELLNKLVDTSLCIIERDDRGRMIYEISHDTLLYPIVESASTRREKEQIDKFRREAESSKQRELEAKRRQRVARLYASGAIMLTILVMIAFIWALIQTRIAKEETNRANKNASLAKEKTIEAGENLQTAIENAEQARVALIEVQKQEHATEMERKRAEENFQRAEEALQSVYFANMNIMDNVLQSTDDAIYHLNYDEALAILKNSLGLRVKEKELGKRLLEMAYFFGEANDFDRSRALLTDFSNLTKNNFILSALKDISNDSNHIENRYIIRSILNKIDSNLLYTFDHKYYPQTVFVKGGIFTMGCDTFLEPHFRDYPNRAVLEDELPRHQVQINDLYFSTTETTFWQYSLYCQDNDIDLKSISRTILDWGFDGDNPAVNINWFEAAQYANWLSKRMGMDTVYAFSNPREEFNESMNLRYNIWDVEIRYDIKGAYRLPTEAEFEFASKGGNIPDGLLYSGSNNLDSVGWYINNSKDRSQPVAQLLPNKLGLFDMSGNVWEWCNDWYSPYPDTFQDNPRVLVPMSYKLRAQRSGSFDDDPFNCSPNARYMAKPWVRIKWSGFRLVRE